jgi:hypothetical protein
MMSPTRPRWDGVSVLLLGDAVSALPGRHRA